MADINPAQLLESISGKEYLNPRNALTWFYNDNPPPLGRVVTVLISYEPTILFRAEVYIGDVLIATGHADADMNSKTLRKIESAAVRRALANAGYGTQQAMLRAIRQSVPPGSTRQALGNGNSGQPRRIGTHFSDRERVKAFVQHYRDKGVSDKELLTALKVERLSEWEGTEQEAHQAVTAYIEKKAAQP